MPGYEHISVHPAAYSYTNVTRSGSPHNAVHSPSYISHLEGLAPMVFILNAGPYHPPQSGTVGQSDIPSFLYREAMHLGHYKCNLYC